MGRRRATHSSYTALVLLSAVSRASAGLWDVDIDQSPAPAPEDGPPFSFYATRDRALLPYQIIGVVGAYIACVLILGSLLLTVGRRARKRAQDISSNRPIEMVRPLGNLMNQTPLSPDGDTKSWYRRMKSKTGSVRSGRSNIGSPGALSVTSFGHDEAHEQHVQRRKMELATLYGAVYGEEDRKNASATDVHAPEPPQYERGQPLPRLAIERPDQRRVQSGETYLQSPMSPGTPRSPSVRAIYPPNMTSPTGGEFPATSNSPAPGLPKSPREGRPASFGSNRSENSPQKTRKALRDIKISNPVQRFRPSDNDDGARTPLSPQAFEDPGRVPPITGRTNESQYPPTTPGTGQSYPYPEETRDKVHALPQPYPQRGVDYQYNNPAQAVTDAASSRPDPTGTTDQDGGDVDELPLRKFARQQQPTASNEPVPLSPAGTWQAGPRLHGQTYGLRSPAIRENVLEYGQQNLNVPITGPLTGQRTPYSPYMPNEWLPSVWSPLETRHQRKQREREQKAVRGAATEKDQVADEKDLWSSGY